MDEVHKSIVQGFQVDASSLKGFVSSLIAAFPSAPKEAHKVEFKDGGVQIFDDIEGVVSLPNVAKKEINSLSVCLSLADQLGNYEIDFRVSNGEKSVIYDIMSPSSNWNKSAQSECDEFSISIKRIFWPKMAENISWILLFFPFLIMIPIMQWSMESATGASRLNELKVALSDNMTASQAIYQYAEWSAHKQDQKLTLFFIPTMIIMMLSTVLTRKNVVNRVFKSQIFYLGRMVNIINQRRTMHAIVWVSIFLSIIVGLIVNWLSRYIMH